MRTHNILHVKGNRKDIPVMPSDLALWFTLTSSNFPYLEHISMVPKVLEPLKFYCIFMCSTVTMQHCSFPTSFPYRSTSPNSPPTNPSPHPPHTHLTPVTAELTQNDPNWPEVIQTYNMHYDGQRGYRLRSPHGTTASAVKTKDILKDDPSDFQLQQLGCQTAVVKRNKKM